MALGRYLVEAVVLERRSVSELARRHGVSRYWIYKLLKRFHEGGFAALEPRSRRPKTCAHETAASVQAEILQLRQELSEAGHDAGPQTIAHHLIGRAEPVPSAATIWRISISPPPASRGPATWRLPVMTSTRRTSAARSTASGLTYRASRSTSPTWPDESSQAQLRGPDDYP